MNTDVSKLASSPSVFAVFERHARRRQDALPTLTTIVGSRDDSFRAWELWCQKTDATCLTLDIVPTESLSDRLLKCVVESSELLDTLLAVAANQLGLPAEGVRYAIASKGSVVLEMMGKYLFENSPPCLSQVFAWAADSALNNRDISTSRFIEWIEAKSTEGVWAFLSELLLCSPHANLPALLLELPESAGVSLPMLQQSTRTVAQVVTAIPRLTIALSLSPARFQSVRDDVPDSFAKAIVLESILRLDRPASAAIVVDGGEFGDGNEGGDTGTVAKGSSSPAKPVKKIAQKVADAARSEAERILFQLLDNDPQLKGLFQLNAKPGIPFGNGLMEIDLACVGLRIALEVDGFWHFTSADRYRTDRRKDVDLQRHGYMVVRFLANDIVPYMQEIRDKVREIVSLRKEMLT